VPTPGGVPRLRSAAFAAAAVGLAVGAHVTAGGGPPVVPLVVGLVALVEAVATAFARRRRGAVATGAALAGSQALLHVVLAAAEPSHAGHAGHAAGVLTPAMLTAHALAAMVLGGLLSHGELVLGWALGLLVPIAAVVPFRPPAPTAVAVVVPVVHAARRWAVTLHDLSRRGPPAGSAAVRA
jgi:hypothetical protein